MAERPDQDPDRDASLKSRYKDEDFSSLYRMAGAGFEFFAGILLFGGIGWLLDRLLGTSPWCLVAGILLGFAAGLLLLVRAARKSFRG